MDKVITPEFRVSFPALFTPVAFNETQKPKYKVNMLFPKGTDLAPMIALAKAAADAKWPDPATRPKNLKNPFRDGDIEKPDTEGYAGHTFVAATSGMKPGVVDESLQPIIDENDMYAGCYAIASVTVYAYDKAGNRGVAFGLQNIKKMRDGDEFSGRAKPEDEFEASAAASVDPVENAGSEATADFLG